MFLGRQTNKVPVRTYGRLSRDGSAGLVFHYRPWLFLPERQLAIPAASYAVGKGLIYSEIIKIEGNHTACVMLLPPRYRTHEAELSAVYGFSGVREIGLLAAFA